LNQNAHIHPEYESDVPCFGVDDVLDLYLPSAVEKERTSKLMPAAGIALRRFARLAAQLGVFTITHREQRPLDSVGDGSHIGRLIIPAAAKRVFAEELGHLKITKLTLFPELESVATIAKEFIR
jgi:hypothetical protein